MKVLSCRISVRLPNTSTQAALIHSMPWIFFFVSASHEICPTVTAMATAVATKMSQRRRATRNDPTGRRSKRNFIQAANSTSRERASAPFERSPARGVVGGPDYGARGGDADGVFSAVGHRRIARAALGCADERQVGGVAPQEHPEVDRLPSGEAVSRSRRALRRGRGGAGRKQLEPEHGVGIRKRGEAAPLDD